MITAITMFQLPRPVTRDEARTIFLSTAPKYPDAPGLSRKCCLPTEDGRSVGGTHLWKSRADADRMYTESWREFVRAKYGTEPTVTYFESPVVVDNVTHEVLTDA